ERSRLNSSRHANENPNSPRAEGYRWHYEQKLMSLPFNIGVLQLSMEPVRETVAMAKACEQAGFDTFWIAEAYPWWRKHSFEARSSTAILAVIAHATKRIQ